MASAVDIAVNIVTKLDDGGISQAQGKFGKFQAGISKMTGPAIAAGAVIAGFGAVAVKAASDTEQAWGGVETVFGKHAGQVQKFAGDAADNVGLAAVEYANLATIIGSQLGNAGIPMDQVAGKTNKLIEMGADLAATYGGTTAQAVEALSSALKGEMDPIEKYGIGLNESAIAAEKAKQGTDKLTGSAASAAKVQAVLAIAQKQSAEETGAFARESDTAAHAQQVATAHYKDAMAVLGQALLPAITSVTNQLADLAKWAGKNVTTVQILVGVIGGLAVGIISLNIALKVIAVTQTVFNAAMAAGNAVMAAGRAIALGTRIQLVAMSAATKAAAAAQWLFNAAMSANPVMLIVIALIALIALFVIAYKRSETFRRIVDAAFRGILTAAKVAWRWIKTAFTTIWKVLQVPVKAYMAYIKFVFNVIRAIVTGAMKVIKAVVTGAWNAIKTATNSVRETTARVWGAIKTTVVNVAKSIKTVVTGAWDAVADKAEAIKTRIVSTFTSMVTTIKSLFSQISGAITSALSAAVSAINKLIRGANKLPGVNIPEVSIYAASRGALVPSGMVATPRVRGRASAGTASATAPVVINVNGALDPDAVARQIRRLLGAHDRRVGIAR